MCNLEIICFHVIDYLQETINPPAAHEKERKM
jgi:hypothetical protein